jgi:hypothetical protein
MIIVYKEAEDINTNTGNIILLSNDHLAQSLHLLSIFYRLFTSLHMADLKALLLRVVSGSWLLVTACEFKKQQKTLLKGSGVNMNVI